MIYEYGNYYHLVNRGCNRELIFRDNSDYLELIKRMTLSDHKSYVKLIAWCLMPNHYHFLVQQISEKPVYSWLRYMFNGYAQYYNQKYERSGTIFEGRARARLITDNNYLFRTIFYIHLNPVLANMVDDPLDWEFSNYADWVGSTKSELTDYEFIEEFYESGAAYREYLKEVQEDKLLQQKFADSSIEFE